MTWPKKRTIIVLFIIVCTFFLIRQTQTLEATAEESKKIEYKAGGLKDPFQEEIIEVEEAIQTGPLPNVIIQGIVWGGAFPQAIINSKVVKVGDTIDKMQILEISKEGIIVLYGKQKHNLTAPSAIQLENLKKKSEGGAHESKF